MTEAMFHLRAGGVSVVVATSGSALPVICHWGRDLGPLDAGALARVAEQAHGTRVTSEPDRPVAIGVLPEPRQAWMGPPGLTGSRDGVAGFPDFDSVTNVYEPVDSATVAERLIATATDAANGLSLRLELELLRSGLLRAHAAVRNDGAGRYRLDGLDLALPVPGRAVELLDFSGRHGGERRPQRSAIVDGTHLREQRRGRPGPDSATLLVAGTADFDFGRGEVWAVHLGWSGNARLWAHRTNGGRTALGGGELLLPGEIGLDAGEEYETPWLYAAHGEGLDDASARIHEALRTRPRHPAVGRPVTLNTWEAVYFDHTLEPLHELADLAAEIGVERFVLDDGWFLGRRHDRAGLGDWVVDPAAWPQGLAPLVERVRERGMQFGLWFEPEMINPDSELARAHPDWILAPLHRDAPLARQQLVLNVGNPDARTHLRDRIVEVVTAHRIDYIKWDHNRDLVEPVDRTSGRAGVHRQTSAVYALIDEIRTACPWLEIESCSAGGGRIDLGIVERTDRFWTSDSNDPLERQRIQRWTSLLMPPELLGAHVGAATAHVTGRSSSIDFRAITAMVGSFGIEWDIREATADERASLAGWIAEFVRLRPLIERGRMHRLESEPSILAQTVVSADRAHAIATIAAIDSPAHLPGPALRLTGIDPEAVYRVARVRPEASVDPTTTRRQPDWWTEPGIWPGTVLAEVGLPMPILRPQEAGLIELVAQ